MQIAAEGVPDATSADNGFNLGKVGRATVTHGAHRAGVDGIELRPTTVRPELNLQPTGQPDAGTFERSELVLSCSNETSAVVGTTAPQEC